MNKINLSIIIVSWNVTKLLQQCLESIYAETSDDDLKFEIIVVDNDSSDGTIEMIKKKFPQVLIIANDKNLGFAAANNQGLLKSRGDYILTLNPDTLIKKNAIIKMVNFMKTNHKIGIAGCKHLNPDLTLQPSVRRFPNIFSIFLLLTKLAHILPNIPTIRHYLAKDLDYKITQPVDQVAGSFFMLRRTMLDEIGLFDENFFIWFEEVDMCQRAKKAGWEIWYNQTAKIVHYGGRSFNQQITIKKQGLFFKSAIYYLKKHGFFSSTRR